MAEPMRDGVDDVRVQCALVVRLLAAEELEGTNTEAPDVGLEGDRNMSAVVVRHY